MPIVVVIFMIFVLTTFAGPDFNRKCGEIPLALAKEKQQAEDAKREEQRRKELVKRIEPQEGTVNLSDGTSITTEITTDQDGNKRIKKITRDEKGHITNTSIETSDKEGGTFSISSTGHNIKWTDRKPIMLDVPLSCVVNDNSELFRKTFLDSEVSNPRHVSLNRYVVPDNDRPVVNQGNSSNQIWSDDRENMEYNWQIRGRNPILYSNPMIYKDKANPEETTTLEFPYDIKYMDFQYFYRFPECDFGEQNALVISSCTADGKGVYMQNILPLYKIDGIWTTGIFTICSMNYDHLWINEAVPAFPGQGNITCITIAPGKGSLVLSPFTLENIVDFEWIQRMSNDPLKNIKRIKTADDIDGQIAHWKYKGITVDVD